MNISYNWLKEYVNFDLTPDEVAWRPVEWRKFSPSKAVWKDW